MFCKQVFDKVVSFLGLVVLSWLYVLLMILIWLDSKSSVFYVQKRVGKDGELFNCHKFRTMKEGCDDSPICISGDDRVTSIGSFLRRYHLDELPQLWDVFIGKMSFVGPRPDVPGYADRLEGEDRAILKLRPGITGPASLKYRNEEEILAKVKDPRRYNDEVIYPDKVRLNLYYLEHYSFWIDIKIIFATVLGKTIVYNGERI